MLIELISNQKLDNPLYPEIILSENIAMTEWLYIKISEYFSISANIKFFSSSDFIWSILGKSLWGIFPERIISHSTISWILMKILSSIKNGYKINNDDINCNFSIVREYLDGDDNQDKCLQLSEKIKNLFVQYFIYHQDWLFQWEDGKMIEGLDVHTQSWQSMLWRLFLKEINNYKGKKSFFYFQCKIYEYILNFLRKNNVNLNELPKRIFIYGISYFSPVLLEILQSLGKYIKIYIFCINPCRSFLKKNINYHNIISIVRNSSLLFQCFSSTRQISIFNRKILLSNQSIECSNIGNFLLFSWGGRFQETFYSLLQLEIISENNIFIDNVNNISLLHVLQNDILNDYSENVYPMDFDHLTDINICSDIQNRLLCSNDDSLSVHICHSVQREVEVLHDNLLAMISNDPLLLPHEIIVMAPNINDYVSSIHSVFSSSSTYGRHLPFEIFDNSLSSTNIVISSFLKLLNLSYTKFSIEEILELLSVPSLALRFNINKDGVKLLSTWILESGICWGLDDDDISFNVLVHLDKAQYTWSFGITRMLLSYAINSANGFWNGILSYDIGDSISSMDLVGQLSCLLMKLKYWKNRFLKSYTLEEWLPLAEEIINDFYVVNYDIETELTLLKLKSAWKEIVVSGIEGNYHEPIQINILCRKLNAQLNKKKMQSRFFSGSIIFCNIDSAESIPFKVIYLLGINENVYPMNNKIALNFDLMQYEARLSDCHRWCNDCYLFLEALLSAREKLYISCIGYSMHDCTRCFLSGSINELFEYITHHFFYLEKNTKKILPITINWIYHNLCHWYAYMPFCLENFASGRKNQSFFKEWFPIYHENNYVHTGRKKFSCSLSEIPISVLSFDSLRNFYFHPVRTWFHDRLKIYVPKMLVFPTDEPFFVETRVKYKICEDLISSFLNKKDINILYERVRCSGILPYGNFGNIFWIEQCEMMLKLSKIINQYYFPTDRHDSQFFLNFDNGVQLNGILNNVQKNGLLRWKSGVLSVRDGLLLWLEHLIYCATGGKGDSWMFGMNSSWHFISLPYMEAKEYLLFLVSGYFHGLITPLLLLNHSGGCWLRNCFDTKKKSISTDFNCQVQARRRLIVAWEGNKYIHGDSSDPYISRLIPQLRDEDIESIISSAKKYFLFPMKFNV